MTSLIKKEGSEALGKLKSKPPYDNSISSQRSRILKHFEVCPRLSTMQARDDYGILHPSGRVMELRKNGHIIQTHWISEPDANGVTHRVGLYVYQGKSEVHYEKHP